MENIESSGAAKTVFGLWFVQEREGAEAIELLIGLYESEADAKSAIERVRTKPGFADFPEGLQIYEYELGRDNWPDGFVPSD